MHHTSWYQARQLLHRAGEALTLTEEEIPLAEAVGRTLTRDARALLPVPHYDSSAMDGYATAGAPPWQVLTHPPAADGENIHRKTLPLAPGQATPILTGGLLPPGTEAVIRQEHGLREGNTLSPDPRFFSGQGYPSPGADIRRAGEELPAGSNVLAAGTCINARHLGALATLGLDTLTVTACPTVAIAYTGNEIITAGLPGPGQVRDAYSLAFPSIIEDLGAAVTSTCRLPDSKAKLTDWLTATRADLLLITGGSSTSTADWVRRALHDLQASYLFESVAIRPGHPALAAHLPASSNLAAPLVLGLPGNPLAAYTALYSYLNPWLTGATAAPLDELPTGVLTHEVPGYRKHDLRLLPASLSPSPHEAALTPLPKTQSHMLTSFATADALALVPPAGAAAGSTVSYLPLPH